MGGNGDVHGDVSGEEAAWRDLIARFDLPVDTVTAQPPWPAREDLSETGNGSPGAGQATAEGRETREPTDTTVARDQAGQGSAGLRRPGSLPDSDAPRSTGSPDGPAGPDGPDSLSLNGAETSSPGTAGTGVTDTGAAGTGAAGRGAAGTGAAGTGVTGTEAGNGAGQPEAAADGWDVAEAPGGRRRIIRRARSVSRPAAGADAGDQDQDDEDDTYIPPPPEPLPPLDPLAKGAWLGLLGGPGYLLVATLVGWQVSDWAALVAIIGFIGGFATLVLRMGDKPRDEDDDGAVV